MTMSGLLDRLRDKLRGVVPDQLLSIIGRVIGYTLLWYMFSIGITFYNKWLFQWYGFHFPLSVTSVHMLLTFGWSGVARRYLTWAQGVQYKPMSWRNIFTRIFPAGATAALDIGLSNAAIATEMHINLYTICKSTVVVFVLMFGICFGIQKPSWRIGSIIFLVVFGVILFEAKDDISFHSTGFFLVFLAAMFGGLRWVLTQVLLKSNDIGLNGTVDTLYYVAPCMTITLLPFAIFAEGPKLIVSPMLFHASHDVAFMTIISVLLGACLAFCLTISEFLLVEYAGSLTLSIAGVFKELVTMVLAAAVVKGNELSTLNLLGLFVSLAGIGLYNYTKYWENIGKQKGYKQVNNDIELTEPQQSPTAAPRTREQELNESML